MADAAAAEEKAPAPAPAFPVKLVIIIALVALVMGVGGAFVAVKFLGGSNKGEEASDGHKAEAPAKGESPKAAGGGHGQSGAPGVMFDLDPFIVNLADAPDIRYLKLTVKLEAENETVPEELTARIPQIRDAVLVLLSSKDVNAVRTTQGKFQLRDEITQRINGLLSKPGIRSAYFTEFVVQ